MAVNKVVYGSETLIDLTEDTATKDTVVKGYTLHLANGTKATGTFDTSQFKTVQTAKSSPTASGSETAFIDTISQDANGVITATKKTIPTASTTSSGIMPKDMYAKLDNIDDGAEENQNAYASVAVVSSAGAITKIYADDKSSVLKLRAGANITMTVSDSGDYITIKATNTTYSAMSQTEATTGTATTSRTMTAKVLNNTIDNKISALNLGGVSQLSYTVASTF